MYRECTAYHLIDGWRKGLDIKEYHKVTQDKKYVEWVSNKLIVNRELGPLNA